MSANAEHVTHLTDDPETPGPGSLGLEPEEPAARAPAWRFPLRTALALAAIATAGALAVLVVALALAATTPEYGFRPNTDSQAWAVRPVAFAPRAGCARCHAERVALVGANAHATASCQGCHGTGTAHENAREPSIVDMAIPASAICVRCHTSSVGRPVTVAQITVSRHYTAACLDCHNPHTALAIRPPTVSHPLAHLPPCIVCHGPDGFRARDQRHPVEPTDDNACLSCHALGRGQIDVRGPRR
jgi:hypothetical protein